MKPPRLSTAALLLVILTAPTHLDSQAARTATRFAHTPEDAAMQAIRPEAIRAHLTFLADDLLEGRGTGTRGQELAARYVAAQFDAMGLEPAGANGTYFQPIRFRSVLVVPDETSVEIVQNGNEETLVYGRDYFANGDPRQPVSSLSGQVVYVGYGVTASGFGIDDYKGMDVRGKIVAILRGAQSQLPSAERAHYGNEQNKLDNAASHGAIGAIQLRNAESEKVQPFSRALRQSALPTMSWLEENGHPNGRAEEIRNMAVLSVPGTEKLFSGSIPDKPLPLPVSISIRTVSHHSSVTSSNVAAVLRGADPRLRDEYVIYTAHTDHLGIGVPVNGHAIYNGAFDNASGTAVLIEVARAFTHLEPRQRRSVLFLAPTAEEKGLLGSDYFVEHPTVPRSQIVADVNMDSQNLQFDFRDVVLLGAEHSSLGTVAARAAAKMNLEVTPDPVPEQGFFRRSDQYSFVRRGIPSLFLRRGTKAVDPRIDGLKAANEWYATIYHTPSDDLTQHFDWGAGVKSAKLSFLLGYIIAQDNVRPIWNDGDFFGETFGRGH
jgi:hypothetical protein